MNRVERDSGPQPGRQPCASGDGEDRPARRGGVSLVSRLQSPVAALEGWALRRLLVKSGHPPVEIWVGSELLAAAAGETVARMQIRDRRTLWRLLIDPFFEFGEAYTSGAIQIDGQLTDLLVAVYRALGRRGPRDFFPVRLMRLWGGPRTNTLSKSRDNAAHHYDLGNDFYRLWLDDQLVYTCAYFATPTLTLEQAQQAKLEHVCRKLRLRRGQSVVEAGCGWGALAVYMAQRYGVTVQAFDISQEQIAYAQELARRSGLENRVEFIHDDWRAIRQQCDVFVSVGMLEHVGADHYHRLGETIRRCLKPEGYGLIHSIGQNHPQRLNSWIQRRIFPGAYPPTLRQMMDIFEPHDYSVLDVENLRLHYAWTLQHWLERFERSAETVGRMFDERFVRMWRLYLAGSQAAFQTGALQLFQVLFTRAGNNRIPWTRGDLYASGQEYRVSTRWDATVVHAATENSKTE